MCKSQISHLCVCVCADLGCSGWTCTSASQTSSPTLCPATSPSSAGSPPPTSSRYTCTLARTHVRIHERTCAHTRFHPLDRRAVSHPFEALAHTHAHAHATCMHTRRHFDFFLIGGRCPPYTVSEVPSPLTAFHISLYTRSYKKPPNTSLPPCPSFLSLSLSLSGLVSPNFRTH